MRKKSRLVLLFLLRVYGGKDRIAILGLPFKNKISNFKETYLKLGEVLIALSMCSATNPVVQKVLENIDNLSGCELHSTHMISDDETIILSNLGINATCGTEIDIN